MSKKPPAPKLPIRPHTYVPDFGGPVDWEGNLRCAGCSMPEKSRVHDYKAPADNAARIIGESE